MKTGIVTTYDPRDYGNRLQNFAMHTILSELGLDCETLIPRQNRKTQYRRKRESHIRKLYHADPAEAQKTSPEITRQIRFEAFEKQYLPSRKLDTVAFSTDLARDYKWIVTGGETVWNPWIRGNLGKIDNQLLGFARSGQRVCMAPSVAAEVVPEHLRQTYHDRWVKYPRLNVRFPEDARLIRELTGREADILLDPVLLVDSKHWQALMRPLPDFEAQEGTCLVWFRKRSAIPEEAESRISAFLAGEECPRCFLGTRGEGPAFTAGPEEFLYLLNESRVVVTDAYYGVVFALIFGKPFVFCPDSRAYPPGQLTQKQQVESLLRQLKIPCFGSGECLWASETALGTDTYLSELARSRELLRKTFRLDTYKPEKEASCR